ALGSPPWQREPGGFRVARPPFPAPPRLERLARDKLGMLPPRAGSVISARRAAEPPRLEAVPGSARRERATAGRGAHRGGRGGDTRQTVHQPPPGGGSARVIFLAILFWGLLAAVFGRALVLQVYERERLRELAQDQYVRQIEIPARRGDIFDRHGVPLAQSVEMDSIWVDPSLLPSLAANA